MQLRSRTPASWLAMAALLWAVAGRSADADQLVEVGT